MKVIRDFKGRAVRLTDERIRHILEHPEMGAMAGAMGETLLRPEKVTLSQSDPDARLYYRFYPDTPVGEKYLCVIVKQSPQDAFVLTAYLTDTVKRGELLWPKR